jgi:Leucine-rich repeat (LRR) protein
MVVGRSAEASDAGIRPFCKKRSTAKLNNEPKLTCSEYPKVGGSARRTRGSIAPAVSLLNALPPVSVKIPTMRSICVRVVLAALFALPVTAADADRDVALWALRMNGAVILEGSSRPIRDIADLPPGEFRIVVLNMIGTNMHPPHMEAFSKLTALRELHVPGPMWNPRAESRTEYSEDMRHIAGLQTLKKLAFGYTFLEQIRFYDVGLDKIQSLGPTLEELWIRRARIKGAGLRYFTNLRTLDITWTLIDDEGMKSLAAMTKLQKLWAQEIRITDKGIAPLANLVDLEEVHLGGVPVTDAGLVHLSGLTKLKKLDLLSSQVSDAGMRHLAGMKDLEYLNLYATRVSNAGLETLKHLAKLREVDLRYSRATQAGVDGLRAALPNTRFIFLDSSTPSSDKKVLALAGKGDAAIADWVKSIGGSALMDSGALVEISLRGTRVSDDHLKNLSGLANLRKLNLDSTEVGDLGVQRLAGLTRLAELSLNNTGVSDAALESVGKLRNLRVLRLNNTLVEGAGLRKLSDLRLEELSLLGAPFRGEGLEVVAAMTGLKRLSLAQTDVTDDALKHLSALTAIEHLDLASTDIGDQGLACLKGLTGVTDLALDHSFRFTDAGFAHLAGMTKLKKLGMLRTRISDKSAKVIAGFTALEHLNLDYTDVGDETLRAVAGLTGLKTLGVDSTHVGDKSRDALLALKNLERLNLYHTLVSEGVYKEIHSAMPACKILWDADSASPNRRRS